MLFPSLAVIGGLGLLTFSADQFVVGSARLSAALRISPVVIGALVIGFGTSAPELLVSGLAAGQGHLDLAVGNIVGSNVANLTLVLGVAALIRPLRVTSRTLAREAPLAAVGTFVLAVLVQGGLSRLEGSLLLVAMVAATTWILASAGEEDPELLTEVERYAGGDRPRLKIEMLRAGLGLLGTLAGAQILIRGAEGIAERLGVAEGVVGLTLVALGTSLPELVTAIQAARRNEGSLIVGNLLGSTMTNSLAVAGVAGVVGPGPLVDPHLAGVATLLMAIVAATGWFLMGTGRIVHRWEGVLLLAGYVGAFVLMVA
jgi:cation:H+ antiporter